ncbi:MAG: HAMP domain-containing protein [Spirochaetales bacterium]|nr:HAMP domain-containing protein [Spirochaetales bacterium]
MRLFQFQGYLSLKWRIALLFSFVSVIIFLFLSIWGYLQTYQREKERIIQAMTREVETSVNEIDSWFQTRITALNTLAEFISTPGTLETLLKAGEDFNPYLSPFINYFGINPYIGLSGHPPYYGGDFPQPPDYQVETRPWFKNAMKNRTTSFTDYYIDSETKTLTTTLYSPIFGENETINAVLATDLRLSTLMEKLYSFEVNDASLIMIDKNGTILAHEKKEIINTDGLNSIYAEAVSRFLKDRNGVIEFEVGGNNYISAFREVSSTGWILGFWMNNEILFAELRALRASYLVITLISIIIFSILSLLIAGRINKRVLYISDSLFNISQGEGDLTVYVEFYSKDELGTLSENFNNFLKQMKKLISGIKDSSDVTIKHKNILEVNTSETAAAVTEISSNLNSMGQKVELLDNSINSNLKASDLISTYIRQFNDQMDEQSILVEQTTAAVNEINASIMNVNKTSVSKNNAAKELKSKAKTGGEQLQITKDLFNTGIVRQLNDIKDITKLIKGIVSQINILSMNAAIEAAHAGSSGKGFAVVADEVRKLAESSSASINNIENAITKINKAVIQTSASVEKTALSFNDINNSVDNFTSAFEEITCSTNELMTGSSQIIDSSLSLQEITVEVRKGSEKIMEQIISMNDELSKIQRVSGTVSNGIREAVTESRNIVDTTRLTSDVILELDTSTMKLKKELDQFKT